MRDRLRPRGVACALALGASFALPAIAFAQIPGAPTEVTPAPALPPNCVAKLDDSATGSGAKVFVSHYVTDGAYAYGEARAGAFGTQSLWTKRGVAWCKVPTGIVALDRLALERFGVPPATARRLLAKMRAAGDVAPPVALPTPNPRPSTKRPG